MPIARRIIGVSQPEYWQYFETIANLYTFVQNIDMEYHVQITPWMREVSEVLFEELVGVDNCIHEFGRNLIVEVPRSEVDKAVAVLGKHFPDVVDIRKAYQMVDVLHDFILVKPMISESPLIKEEGIVVPSAEKALVDLIADKEYASLTDTQKNKSIQRVCETYRINHARIQRYAARKGKKEELMAALVGTDGTRIDAIANIQRILTGAPVMRAWLFGSYARMEERPDSDIDLLVDFEKNMKLGLMELSKLVIQMEKAVGRKVDLVETASLKPFARESVEKDKVLIYERAR